LQLIAQIALDEAAGSTAAEETEKKRKKSKPRQRKEPDGPDAFQNNYKRLVYHYLIEIKNLN
jgi:hypothetical protein